MVRLQAWPLLILLPLPGAFAFINNDLVAFLRKSLSILCFLVVSNVL